MLGDYFFVPPMSLKAQIAHTAIVNVTDTVFLPTPFCSRHLIQSLVGMMQPKFKYIPRSLSPYNSLPLFPIQILKAEI